MPYQAGERLPGERASRLGHLDVLRSELVLRLCESFEAPAAAGEVVAAPWQPFPSRGAPLPLVFGIDGSMQAIQGELPPFKALAFVKTALLRLDQYALAQVDQAIPHPFQLRDILSDSALYHATVFPLRHVSIPGLSTYDAVRQIIDILSRCPSFQFSLCTASFERSSIEDGYRDIHANGAKLTRNGFRSGRNESRRCRQPNTREDERSFRLYKSFSSTLLQAQICKLRTFLHSVAE